MVVFMKLLYKILNFLTFKHKNHWYFSPHENCLTDRYDLLNYSSDNILSFIRYLMDTQKEIKAKIYLEINDMKLVNEYNKLNNGVLNIKYVLNYRSPNCKHRFLQKIKNTFVRFGCNLWVCCSPSTFNNIKVRKQKIICLSYCTPFKSDIINNKIFDLFYLDCRVETSLLTASIHSAEFRNKVTGSQILGFPRNDFLLKNNNSKKVSDWLKSKTNKNYEKIIVYAPTYRDYGNPYINKNVLGYSESNEKFYSFLENHNYLFIVKSHPLQKLGGEEFGDRIIYYEPNQSFSLYDLLYASDMLISDYSSVIHDYLLTGKPVVINGFDIERYKGNRGFAFDPVEMICPSKICKTYNETLEAIEEGFLNKKLSGQYIKVREMFHKYIDSNSCGRVYRFFNSLIK